MPHVRIPSFKDEQGIEHVVLNPKIPVVLYVCLGCWNILDDVRAYCRRCGRSGTCFEPAGQPRTACFTHPAKPAANFCNECSRAFCADCLQETASFFTMGTYSYRCHLCIADMKQLEAAHAARDTAYCLRHPDQLTQHTCRNCGERLCRFCAYHPVGGILTKRVEPETFCFSCVRQLVGKRKVRHTVIEHFAHGNFQQFTF
ncbi:MAG: hypothetical protein DME33_16115 [Verrucomicrobia bacterium]|nr:MAG: hypothetical protein DME33_16115 [Verrucomicrobiota bacterium]